MYNVIQVAPREVLLTRDNLFALSFAITYLPISRRRVLEWLAETLYRFIEDGGVVLDGDGRVIDIYPGITDDAHGEDGSGVWISEQRKRGYPRRAPRQTLLMRFQLYDAAFRLVGRPVGVWSRKAEAACARAMLASLSPVRRVLYRHKVKQLAGKYKSGADPLGYSAALRRLRVQMATEQAHWDAAQ